MNSPATQTTPQRRSSDPFQTVMITLSAAMLVLFGIVIGRFVVTAQAVEVVDEFDADLTTLRAELVVLRQRLATAQTDAELAHQSAERYRRAASQHQIRADQLAARQLVFQGTLNRVREDRQICLEELQQHVALEQPIPAGDVVRFVEQMYSSWAATLQQVVGEPDPATQQSITFPRLTLSNVPVDEPPSTLTDSAAAPVAQRTLAPLPAPRTDAAATQSRLGAQSSGVFFSPPRSHSSPKRSKPYSYFPARPGSRQVSTLPSPSGITFLDTAGADQDTVRR